MPTSADLKKLTNLYDQGRMDAALEFGTTLLNSDPNDASLNNMVGVLCARLDHLDAALDRYDKALTLRDGYAEVYNNRGNVLVRLNRLDDAIASYRNAIQSMPNYADAHNGLGNALRIAGRPAEAADAFSDALKIRPDFAQASVGLGRSLSALGYHRQALAYVQAGLNIDPNACAWHNDMGNILSDLNRLEEAERHYRRALELEPDAAEYHSNLAIALGDQGKTDEAIASYEKAIELRPTFCEAHYNLSALKRYEVGDPQFAAMESLVSGSDISDSDRSYLCFALGKACEDMGQVDRSFEFLVEGNRLRKSELAYDIETDVAQFEQIRTTFGERTVSPGAASGKPRPIFIVGMPRSGTSLVEQILASHSEVYGAGELDYAARILSPKAQGQSVPAEALRKEYLDELRQLAPDSGVVTDKMPGNFRWIGFLLEAMPEARIVHVSRNPVATCWSMYKRMFQRNGFTNDLQDLARYYSMYIDLVDFWREHCQEGFYDLDYERLTEDPDAEIRKLLEYCDLPWEDACLDFHKTQRAVRTASSTQVREKIYTGSSEAWRPYASHLEPLVTALDGHN